MEELVIELENLKEKEKDLKEKIRDKKLEILNSIGLDIEDAVYFNDDINKEHKYYIFERELSYNNTPRYKLTLLDKKGNFPKKPIKTQYSVRLEEISKA